jgi:hypothetical protein
VWNYLLGGKDNFAVDREVGGMILQMCPGIARVARTQRRFLVRAVRFLAAEAGIRQFLDIGMGLPTAESTHRVAQQIAPQSRVVYVDNDPLVLVHARALMTSTSGGSVGYVEADVRDTEEILQVTAGMLDFRQPVALIMVGMLGELSDGDDPRAVVARLLQPLPSGSYLALSDGTDASFTQNQAIAAYNQQAASAYQLRSPEQITSFFGALALVPPGVVSTSHWRPGLQEASRGSREVAAVCGVGRKNLHLRCGGIRRKNLHLRSGGIRLHGRRYGRLARWRGVGLLACRFGCPDDGQHWAIIGRRSHGEGDRRLAGHGQPLGP